MKKVVSITLLLVLVVTMTFASGQEETYPSGKVNVIVPGPNHPTTIYGEVFEQKVRHPSGEEGENYDVRTDIQSL